jgi:CspA family cold shock protein
MSKGIVRWFSNAFGYGFIQDQAGIDIFVHYSAIQLPGYKTLHDGQEVEFEVEDGPKGQHATVVVVSEAAMDMAQAA